MDWSTLKAVIVVGVIAFMLIEGALVAGHVNRLVERKPKALRIAAKFFMVLLVCCVVFHYASYLPITRLA